ncbi:MAG: hypothetical protein QM703_27565 [Gemmatales bacterium]
MPILLLMTVSCFLTVPSVPHDLDKVNQLVQQYNEVNRTELAKLLQAFDQTSP